jgi:outer membrane lipase/esterase
MSKLNGGVRARCVGAGLAVLLLLAACGGGTQVERFVPTRMLVFGDENSVIDDSDVATPGDRTANGRKYTVNGFTAATPPAPDCRLNPIWIQYMIGLWGLVLPQCNPNGVAAPSRIHAQAGAGVDNLAAQITAAGALGAKDLATVFVGANDIFTLYGQYTGANEVALIAQARVQATTLAAQIARIVKTGSKVVFVTVPELGSTPFAVKENAAHPDQDRAGVLNRLTIAFNTRLRTEVSSPSSASFIDGHQGVQVLADELFRSIVNVVNTTPSSASYLNASVAICDPALAVSVINCTSSTLITATSTPALATGGTVANYIWADDKHLSPGGHAALGATAANRTNANPL